MLCCVLIHTELISFFYVMMKKLILLYILILNAYSVDAQVVKKEKAYRYAETLHRIDILNENGSDELKQFIKEFDVQKNIRFGKQFLSADSETPVFVILLFLYRTFNADFYFRTGQADVIAFLKESREQLSKERTSNADHILFKEHQLDSIVINSPGYKIEQLIEDEDRIADRDGNYTYINQGYGLNYNLISPKRSVMGKTCTRTLKDLYAIGLIDAGIYNEANAKLENDKLREGDLLKFIAERVFFNNTFEQQKLEDISHLEELNSKALLSNQSMQQLLAVHKDRELLDRFELLSYCNRAKSLNTRDYDARPELGFKEVFEDIKKLIPTLEDAELDVKVFEVVSNYDYTEIMCRVSFDANETTYANEFYYSLKKDGREDSDTVLRINNEFHLGINKYLADLDADYRLHYTAKNRLEGNAIYILLNEEQYDALDNYHISRHSYNNTFNTKNINQFIAEYKKNGLFDHLTEDELREARACVASSVIESYTSILNCYPKTLVDIEWETSSYKPYEEVTLDISMASRGDFTPTSIIDQYQNSHNQTVEYGFEFNGKSYLQLLELQSDWLDPAFFELIEKAMEENKLKGKLYQCYDGIYELGFLYLNQKQYKFLVKHQKSLLIRAID